MQAHSRLMVLDLASLVVAGRNEGSAQDAGSSIERSSEVLGC
jgi:hypothetical protein